MSLKDAYAFTYEEKVVSKFIELVNENLRYDPNGTQVMQVKNYEKANFAIYFGASF